MDFRQQPHERPTAALAGSNHAELHPSGSATGENYKSDHLHVFRHTFSTLLAENDEDVKTVQSLMRHANSNITMNIYTHAVSSKKRRAQQKVVEMILPEGKTGVATKGVA